MVKGLNGKNSWFDNGMAGDDFLHAFICSCDIIGSYACGKIIIVELAAFLLEVMIAAFKFIIDPIRQILKKSP